MKRKTIFWAIPLCWIAVNCKTIHTEIQIESTPEKVWSVLADTDRYAEWNPYHVRVRGELSPGSELEVEIHKPNGNRLTIKPEVQVLRPRRELSWGGGVPGLFTGKHVFELFPNENGVRLVQREKFQGLFVPFAELGSIEEGYDRMNRALKRRVEGGPPRPGPGY